MLSSAQLRSATAVRAATLALVLAAAAAASAGPAHAGRYHVYSCRTPSGASAPADGWSGSTTGSYSYAEDTCSQPDGALIAALREAPRTANTDIATWTFGVPAGETITGATLWRAGDADGGAAINASYEFWFAGPENNLNLPADNFGQCEAGSQCPGGLGTSGEPLSSANLVVVPEANLGSHFFVSAGCVGASEYSCPTGKADPNNYAAEVSLYAADITLEQAAGPTAGNVSGELASAPAVGGTSDLAFTASDPGSGIYEALFSVDGRLVQSTVVDEDGGRCRSAGEAADGTPAFLYVQPCLGSVSVDVPFDTTAVANGAHHLLVSVIDAAGNTAPVLDREVTFANASQPGPPNGVNASPQASLAVRWASTRRESVTSGYGRAQAVSGRLLDSSGTPIAGAQIAVTATPAYEGARPVAMASPRTGADGRFSVRVAGGVSSRTLRFAYSSRLNTPPVATRTLKLNVRAGVSLTVAPHTASVGSSIFFHGRLRGGPIPADGKQLVLEARSPGSPWLEFDVVRTDAHGRFHASYRFKFPGPASYQFRVLSEPESDYPFAAGASDVVAVREH